MEVPQLTPEMMAEFPPAAVELIKQLLGIIQAQATIISAQNAKIASLEAKIVGLEAKLNQNSRNSSKPPSSDGPQVKRTPPKPKSGHEPGGQPGHPKQSRELIDTSKCEAVVPCLPTVCRNCSAPLRGTDAEPIRYQVSELPVVKPIVTEYQLHRIVCTCGCSTAGTLPEHVTGQDGPRLRACVTMLTGAYRLSKTKAASLLGALFQISMSAGQVCAIEARTGEELQPVVDQILSDARQCPANIDETSLGKKRWLWVMVTSIGTYYQIVSDRTRSQLTKLIGTHYRCVLTSDRHSVYSHLPVELHQCCWAHLRRDFQAMIDRKNGGFTIGSELLSLSDELFDHWKRVRDGTLSKKEFVNTLFTVKDFRTRFRNVLQRGTDCGCQKTMATCRQLLSQEVSLYRFVYMDGVEPTNNAAERALRHGVIWRKQSHGPKSITGSRFLANIWSITETCRQHGRNLWQYLTESLKSIENGKRPTLLRQPINQAQAA